MLKKAPAAVCRHQYGDRARDPLHDLSGVLLHTTHANLERESVDMIIAVAADPLQLNWPDTASRLPTLRCAYRPTAACA